MKEERRKREGKEKRGCAAIGAERRLLRYIGTC
jgi:hypothetical protein